MSAVDFAMLFVTIKPLSIPDIGKLGPRAKSGPPVFLFWLAGTHRYTNLNSHLELSGRPFFFFRKMDSSDFQKNKSQWCKIGIKNEVKTFYFGDHIRTWTVISKKRSSPCFPISVWLAASTVFSKSGPSCEKLAHPWSILTADPIAYPSLYVASPSILH